MHVVNPRLDRAVYRQVADLLRARIDSGALAPGDMLPSESVVIQRYGVSRTTVRLAVGILRSEGLVVTEHGRGTFVRHRPTVRRRVIGPQPDADGPDDGQIEVDPPDAPPTPDLPASWDADGTTITVETDEVAAPQEIADLLIIETGTALVRRRFVLSVGGLPHQISTSYLPLDVAAGIPVGLGAKAWPGGTLAQLAAADVTVTAVEESVRARMPTPEESDALDLSPGVPVLSVVRRLLAGERPVEVSSPILVPSDRVVLDYRVDL